MASIRSGICCWALFWTGPVWWEGLVYGNRRERVSERRGKKMMSCLLALSFLLFFLVSFLSPADPLPLPPSPPFSSPFHPSRLLDRSSDQSAGCPSSVLAHLVFASPRLQPARARARSDWHPAPSPQIGRIHPWGGCCWSACRRRAPSSTVAGTATRPRLWNRHHLQGCYLYIYNLLSFYFLIH